MIGLLHAEAQRAWARRLVRLLMLLAVLGAILGGALGFATSHSLSERTYQERVAAMDAADGQTREQLSGCVAAGHTAGNDDPRIRADCFPHVHDPRFKMSKLKGILQGVSGTLALIGWLLGASLIGAEFPSRSLTTTMTVEPRRGRLFVAKAAVAAASAALLAVFALLVVALALVPAATIHGAPRAGQPGMAQLAGVVCRGVALCAVTSGIGFAIASVGRNTAAALGAGFAYIIVLENILGSTQPQLRRWLLLGNVIVFVSGRNSGGEVFGRSVTGAGVWLVCVAVGLLIGAFGVFRVRDVA